MSQASLTLYFMSLVLRYPVTPVRKSELRSEETFIDAKRAFWSPRDRSDNGLRAEGSRIRSNCERERAELRRATQTNLRESFAYGAVIG